MPASALAAGPRAPLLRCGAGLGLLAGALCAALAVAMPAQAQDYPARPIRLVVAYPPGGAVDLVARILAERLATSLGQPVIVDNKAGAGGLIGSDQVAKAAPDGYTLLLGTVSSHAIAPSVYKKMPYDPIADFAPVSLVALTPYIITVNANVPARTLAELIALAKAKPDTLNFGSSGNGTTPHLAGELFNTMAGTKINHIPYKGSAPMVNDLLGGQVQVAFDNTVIPNIKAGKLRGLAVTGPARLEAVPDIPTAAEAGLPGYEAVGWMGLYAPKGTPAPIVARLADETRKAMAAPDVHGKLVGMGFQAKTDSPSAFDAYLRSETAKWTKVAKDANVQPE
ncbi:MAG: tripartite tricarboxylate transporter substrate binding protein [Casimicrobiaceae bacterium]